MVASRAAFQSWGTSSLADHVVLYAVHSLTVAASFVLLLARQQLLFDAEAVA